MNLFVAFLFIHTLAWAKPTILVSYFDPFAHAPENNSRVVGKMLEARVKKMDLFFDLKTCEVQTKFDVSFEELKDCVNSLPEKPVMVLALGETGCDLKIELMGRNLDRTKGPDNAGVERRNTPIVPGGSPAIGLTYPLPEMYCALTPEVRSQLVLSNNAGSFVCNNLAYQIAYHEKDLNFGFMHVPSHSCRNVSAKNEKIVSALITMINRGMEVSLENPDRPRLPVTKGELEILRKKTKDSCLSSFYKAARAWDEKSWWDIFNPNARRN
jgi:pyrrolidone-carboxylate peptidase